MNDKLLNVIFLYGQKEYKLSEMKNNVTFQNCYISANVMLKPIIKLINDSETFVKIDLDSNDLPKFYLLNKTEDIKKALIEYNISIE